MSIDPAALSTRVGRGGIQWAVLSAITEAPHVSRRLARGLRAHSILIAIVLAQVTAAMTLPALLGLRSRYVVQYGSTFLTLTGLAIAIFMLAYAVVVMIAVRPKQLLSYMWADLSGRCLTLERLSMMLPVLLFLPLMVSAFSFFKMAIPELEPFAWDPLLAEIDRTLHGGYHPWEWLQPLLDRAYITSLLNGGYHLWFGVTYGVLLWQMVDIRRPKLRMRYLLSFVLLWILVGNIAATLFSSAGPVYYGRVTGLADPFVPLMDYLHRANETASVPALAVQDLLWRAYSNSSGFVGGGISAMPSMHIASTFSFVLLGAATARWLGAVFAAFALLIFAGSVHLGWHYAIDGYVAILMTWAIWHGAGWLLNRTTLERLLWGEEGWPSDTVSATRR